LAQRYVDDHYWSFFDNFNFDRNGISVVLSSGKILPQVFGYHVIPISWEQLRGRLNEMFVATDMAKKSGLTLHGIG
jgi:hypothetical protein